MLLRIRGFVAVLATESLDATGRVDQLLFSGIEGVTIGANLHVYNIARCCRAGLYFKTTDATHRNFVIVWMNLVFHNRLSNPYWFMDSRNS